jgi:hypothetical protein
MQGCWIAGWQKGVCLAMERYLSVLPHSLLFPCVSKNDVMF